MTDGELDQRVRASLLGEEIDTSRVAGAVRKEIQSGQRRGLLRIGAVAAAMILAIAGTLWHYGFFPTGASALCTAAAQDHDREIVKGEPRHWRTDMAAIQALAATQGVPESAIAALATTGYRLERARLCFLNRQIFLHLVYSNRGDDELSVFLGPRESNSLLDRTLHQASAGAENVAYFQTDRFTALFVGESKAHAAAFANAGARVL